MKTICYHVIGLRSSNEGGFGAVRHEPAPHHKHRLGCTRHAPVLVHLGQYNPWFLFLYPTDTKKRVVFRSVRDGGRVDTQFSSRRPEVNNTVAVLVPISLVIIFPQFSAIKRDPQVFPIQSGLPSVFDRPSGKVILPQHYTWGFGDSR